MDYDLVASEGPKRTQNEDEDRIDTQTAEYQLLSTTQSEENNNSGESGDSHVTSRESGDRHVMNKSQKQSEEESHGQKVDGACLDNPLAFLREEIQFQMLKQVIRDNSEMLETMMKQIQYSNPQLYKVVQKNERDFRALLQEPDKDESQSEEVSRDDEAVSKEGQKHEGKPLVIKVTAEERHSINRLIAMGVPEYRAVQAYFACNKNEEVAAEFLLQQDPMDR